ncbi:MAG: hypothetical protein IT381_29875 [Deltaproteobacteria bacterium]|nr:hypothetical protein [Deltaproteobacteria bacterium]
MNRHFVLLFLCFAACESEQAAQEADLARLVEASESPTGALETTNSKLLAYTVWSTQRVVDAIAAAASELPGLRQSPTFKKGDAAPCRSGEMRKMSIDYGCLGFASGTLKLLAHGRYPNDNGDYEITLAKIAAAEGEGAIDGTMMLHVEGLGDEDRDDQALMSISAKISGLPESYATLDRPGIVASVDEKGGPIYGFAKVYDQTFVFKDVARVEARLIYSIRDRKNLWGCESAIDGETIGESQCRIPEGSGDWAILRF